MVTVVPDWLRLQKKIFTRWVKQKLLRKYGDLKCEDIVSDISDGVILVRLMETLAEKELTTNFAWKPKSKFQIIDNLNTALKFVWSCGVEMSVKPSAENLFNGEEKSILGLIWAIMSRFIKIGDEEDSGKLNVKDSLLIWAKNKTSGYEGVNIIDFKAKSWADGMALCAIIHKHRPGLIDWSTVSSSTPLENLDKAIDAANIYFHMDKYIKPEDVPKLDENSMVIFVSEFYYGIMEQRKTDVAAKRIEKVISLTKENDRLKDLYNKTAISFKDTIVKAKVVLEDRTIDNTLSGATKRLEDFYEYKKNEKSVLVRDHLSLEANYNNLSMRLSHHKRPPFQTPDGLSLKDVESEIKHLEVCEQERKVSLHKEQNRQKSLLLLAQQHKSKCDRSFVYINNKEMFLTKNYEIKSVGEANQFLQTLNAMKTEIATYISSSVVILKEISGKLTNEKFEHLSEILERDNLIDNSFEKLNKTCDEKKLIFEDDLARETYKERTLILVDSHRNIYNSFMEWSKNSEKYLLFKEEINSVGSAIICLTTLGSFESEMNSVKTTKFVEIAQLTKKIIKMEYKSQYSKYIYENPSELLEKKSSSEAAMENLENILKTQKRPILEDHLSREEFKANVRVVVNEFQQKRMEYIEWYNVKKEYLEFKPVNVSDVPSAEKELSILNSYFAEQGHVKTTNIKELKGLRDEILKFDYKTNFSSYAYEKPDQIKFDFEECVKFFENLERIFLDVKKPLLEDHLQREKFRVNVEVMVAAHTKNFNALMNWTKDQENYLSKGAEINSVDEAKKALDVLKSHEEELVFIKNSKILEFEQNSNKILSQKYETVLSRYVYPKNEEISEMLATVNKKHNDLIKISQEFKRPFLEDCMAREEFRVMVEGMNARYKEKHDDLQHKLDEIISYMLISETIQEVSSVRLANECLRILVQFEEDTLFIKERVYPDLVSQKDVIFRSKYETKFSSYVYPDLNGVASMVHAVEQKLKRVYEINQMIKRPLLEDHLVREELKVEIVGFVEQYKQLNARVNAWIDAKDHYLKTKPDVSSVEGACLQLSLLNSYERELQDFNNFTLPEFKKQTDLIANKKHETKWSVYVYEEVYVLEKIEKEIRDRIQDLNYTKINITKPLLDDHLAREKLKVVVEKMLQTLKDMNMRVKKWEELEKVYLVTKDKICSVTDAELQIALFNTAKDEIEKEKKGRISELKHQAKRTLEEEHKTELSTYKYENPEEIHCLVKESEDAFVGLENLLPEKKEYLDQALELEKEKEKRRLAYARECKNFTIWGNEELVEISACDFGHTYLEVKAYEEKLVTFNDKIKTVCEEKFKGVSDAHKAQEEMNIIVNKYTETTIGDVSCLRSEIYAALEKRNAMYKSEMDSQQQKDDLCKRIADLADSFSEQIISQRRKISEQKDDIFVQLEFVRKLIKEKDEFGKKLNPIMELYKEFEVAELENNRHTTLTEKDVRVLWEQYQELLLIKEKMLIEEIENQKLRGITMEQMKEVEENFKAFDNEKLGVLDTKRFAACLYSLGEERSKKEIDEIVKKRGKDGKITKEAFIDYIIDVFGDSDTKEEVINGFRLISRGKSFCPEEHLKIVVSPASFEYIVQKAPKNEEGNLDYTSWTEDVYSR